MKVFAPAKVNLMLHVTGKRADGYHMLQSAVVFADVGDVIEFAPHESVALEVCGAFAHMVPHDESNLVMGAVRALQNTLGRRSGVLIKLEKNLPVQAGLGGGSADAAAVLRGLNLYWGEGLSEGILHNIARKLGADVPVCLAQKACWVEGVGETLSPLIAPAYMPAVLFWPGVGLSTKDMFARLKGFSARVEPPQMIDLEWLQAQRNDFWEYAADLLPEAGMACELMVTYGGVLGRMSGSGSAFYGVFKTMDEAQCAAEALQKSFNKAWVMPCYLNV